MVNNDISSEASSSDIQAVARVGQICALFGPHTTELTAAAVAEQLNLNRTTAYRYCVSLVAAGILERGPGRGTFTLGGLMLELGIHALGRRRVVEIAPAHLRELSAVVRMTAVLGLWGARGPVVALVQEDVSRALVVTVHPGTQLDASAAQMIVHLAHQSDPHAIDRIAAGLSNAERSELEAAVYAARRNGYAIVDHSDGLLALAAPVFDEHGIAATVALLGAESAENFAPDSPKLKNLLDTADALSAELGGGHEGHRSEEIQ
jgi:DNA-binding IclR family transcriptional regulator